MRSVTTLYFLYRAILLYALVAIASSIVGILSRAFLASIVALAFALLGLLEVLRHSGLAGYLAEVSAIGGPHIILNLRAPLLGARPLSLTRPATTLDLGDRPVDVPFMVEALVHNIGPGEATGIHLQLELPSGMLAATPGDVAVELGPMQGGEVRTYRWQVVPTKASSKPSIVVASVQWHGGCSRKRLKVASCFHLPEHQIVAVSVRRWKYGLLAATAWRGDIDGFGNLNDEKNLCPALDLAGLFRVPPSIFISGRLVLDPEQWQSWSKHMPGKFDGESNRETFDRFLASLRRIRAKNDLEYPLSDDPLPCAQIGNHMYFHYYSRYGYDASADTGWTNFVAPGQYNHSWEKTSPSEKTVLTEIHDNLALNNQLIEAFFGVRPTTWSAPADRPHALYPAALESVGLAGSSEAAPGKKLLLSAWLAPLRPDLGQVEPFHPSGTRIVETGAHIHRFDPHTVNHVVSLKKAVLIAVRKGSQVTYLIHPHLRLCRPHFGPASSLRHFQEILRFLVEDLGSVVWITTHHSIVDYWEKVLCPTHRVVDLSVDGGSAWAVNKSEQNLFGIPVEVRLKGGKRYCSIVDLPAGARTMLV